MRLDHGQIELALGDETLELKPTLGAMQKINRRFGSLREAIEQMQRLDFDSIVFVVEAASGRKDLAERVFEAGLTDVTATVADYLVLLLNPSGRVNPGGREADSVGKASH